MTSLLLNSRNYTKLSRSLGTRSISSLWLLLVFAWSAVQLLPLLSIFYSSLRSTQAIYSDPTGFGGFDPNNYPLVWNGQPGSVGFATYLLNNIGIALIALLIGMGTGTFAAYAISRQGGALWARGLYGLFLLSMAMPYEIFVVPIYQLLSGLHMLNSVIGAGLVYGALIVPTTAVIMRGFFDAFPREILEAASIDGASELSTLVRVVLPLTRGGLIAVLVLSVVYIWGEVQLAIVMQSLPRAKTIAVGMLSFQGQFFTNQGAMFAGLSIACIPLIVLYIIFQKYVTRGLTMGAVK